MGVGNGVWCGWGVWPLPWWTIFMNKHEALIWDGGITKRMLLFPPQPLYEVPDMIPFNFNLTNDQITVNNDTVWAHCKGLWRTYNVSALGEISPVSIFQQPTSVWECFPPVSQMICCFHKGCENLQRHAVGQAHHFESKAWLMPMNSSLKPPVTGWYPALSCNCLNSLTANAYARKENYYATLL